MFRLVFRKRILRTANALPPPSQRFASTVASSLLRNNKTAVSRSPRRPPPSAPSPQDVHNVVQRALMEASWQRAVALLLGAVQLGSIPLADTYEAVLLSAVRNGGWASVKALVKELGTTLRSQRALYLTVVDMMLLAYRDSEYKLSEEVMPFLSAMGGEGMTPEHRQRLLLWASCLRYNKTTSMLQLCEELCLIRGSDDVDEPERELICTAAAAEGNWQVAHRLAPPSRESAPYSLVLYLQSFTKGIQREGVWGVPWREATAHVRRLSGDAVPSEVAAAMEELAAVAKKEGHRTREETASVKQQLGRLCQQCTSSPPPTTAAADLAAAVTLPQASEMLQLVGDAMDHAARSEAPVCSVAACRHMEAALALWEKYPALLGLEHLRRVLNGQIAIRHFPKQWHVVDSQYKSEPVWLYVVDRILAFPNVDTNGKALHRHQADHALVLLQYLSSLPPSEELEVAGSTGEDDKEEGSGGQERPLHAVRDRIIHDYMSLLEDGATTLNRYADSLRLLRCVVQTASTTEREEGKKEILAVAERMSGSSYLPVNVVLKAICEEAAKRRHMWEVALSFYWQNRNHSAMLSPIVEAFLHTAGAWEAAILYAKQCIAEYGDVRVLTDVAAPILVASGRIEELVALMAPQASHLSVKDKAFLQSCKDQLAVRRIATAVEAQDAPSLWAQWTALRPHFGEEQQWVRKTVLEELPEEKREQMAMALLSAQMHAECCTFLHDCLRLKIFSRRWAWKALLMYRTICLMETEEELDSVPSKLRTLTSSADASLLKVTNALVYGLAAAGLVSRGCHARTFDLLVCYVAQGGEAGTASISEQQLWERMPVLAASVAPVLAQMTGTFPSLTSEAREIRRREMQLVLRYFLPVMLLHTEQWSSMLRAWASASLLTVSLFSDAILLFVTAERAVPLEVLCCIAYFSDKELKTLTDENWKLLGEVFLSSPVSSSKTESVSTSQNQNQNQSRKVVSIICDGLARAGLYRDALLCLERSATKPTGVLVSRTLTEAALCYVAALEKQQQQKEQTAQLEKSPLFSPCVAESEVRHLLQQLLDVGDWESVCSVWQRLVKGQLRLYVAPAHDRADGTTPGAAAAAIDMAFVLQLLHDVGAVAPWARVVQLWRELLQTVPYANWEPYAESIGNAFAALMASMRRQGAEINDLCNCVRFLVVQLGLPVPAKVYEELLCYMARGDGSTAVTEAELCYVSDQLVEVRAKLSELKVRQIIHTLDQWVASSTGPRARLTTASSLQDGQTLPSLLYEGRYLPLTEAQMDALAAWAPLVMVGSVRQLEQISQQHFSGHVKPYELKPLLYRHATKVKARLGAASAADTTFKQHQEECLRYLSLHTPFHVLLSECYRSTSRTRTSEEIDAYVRVRCFDDFVTPEVATQLRVSCRDAAVALAECRWTIAEKELRETVWRQNGKLPKKLLTSPHTTLKEITFYWNLFHHVILPELSLDPSDLCVLSAAVPQLAAVRAQPPQLLSPAERERAMWEVAANVRLSFFANRTTPTTKAIHVVGQLAWKSLQKLHKQLSTDTDAPAAMPLLYSKDSTRSKSSSRRRPRSRTVVAALIAQQMERTECPLGQRALSYVLTCARQDLVERPSLAGKDAEKYVRTVWNDMGLTTSLPRLSTNAAAAVVAHAHNSTRDTLEQIHCVVLRSLARIVLSYEAGAQSIPEEVSEALVVRVKLAAQGDQRARADVMHVWKVLSASRTLALMAPVHATALERTVVPSSSSLAAFRKMKTAAQTKSEN